ncbi:MAG: hypothetical protein HC781_04690 [Leptolyngbyaceae cyanobacterium CSU_1_4]|nr:hypothetical protein [Leptolyngbyaceae cyanobacterium CSU_1_4]
MNHSSKFLWKFLGLIAANSLIVASFNAWIDPYNVMAKTVSKVNELKPKSGNDARRFKAINVIRIKPKTIFLGNSRADIGLDPEHSALSNNAPAYNLALPSGDIYEAMRYLQHVLANQPNLKQVVIGVDLIAFKAKTNEGELDPEQAARLGTTQYMPHLPSLLFSTDTFTSSLSTLAANLSQEPVKESYLSNGRLIRFNPPSMSMEEVFEYHLKTSYFNDGYQNFQISPRQMDAFRTIVETCNQRGIDLEVFISPAHVTQWEAIQTAGLWSTFENWKRDLVKITPVWDFSGYNSITAEPIAEGMQNYLESSHYVKEIGDLVLNRLLDYQVESVPKDFGALMTADNVEPHLLKVRVGRNKWANQSPDVVQLVRQWSKD